MGFSKETEDAAGKPSAGADFPGEIQEAALGDMKDDFHPVHVYKEEPFGTCSSALAVPVTCC